MHHNNHHFLYVKFQDQPDAVSEDHGLIYRAFVHLFDRLKDNKNQNGECTFVIKASFLEIYNEKVGTISWPPLCMRMLLHYSRLQPRLYKLVVVVVGMVYIIVLPQYKLYDTLSTYKNAEPPPRLGSVVVLHILLPYNVAYCTHRARSWFRPNEESRDDAGCWPAYIYLSNLPLPGGNAVGYLAVSADVSTSLRAGVGE